MNYEQYESIKRMTEDEKNRYNGYTVEHIVKNLHPDMTEEHKEQYMKNVYRVIECQVTGYNLHEIEMLKNSNFLLTQFYLFN